MKPYIRSKSGISVAEAEDIYWEMDETEYTYRYHHAEVIAITEFLILMAKLHPKMEIEDDNWVLNLAMRLMKRANL